METLLEYNEKGEESKINGVSEKKNNAQKVVPDGQLIVEIESKVIMPDTVNIQLNALQEEKSEHSSKGSQEEDDDNTK